MFCIMSHHLVEKKTPIAYRASASDSNQYHLSFVFFWHVTFLKLKEIKISDLTCGRRKKKNHVYVDENDKGINNEGTTYTRYCTIKKVLQVSSDYLMLHNRIGLEENFKKSILLV